MQSFFWALTLFWILAGAWHAWHRWRWRYLPVASGNAGAEAPFVSLLLPARNEADRLLSDCVRSLLGQEYPSYEVVAVDDCSTDATGNLLREMAHEDQRLRVLRGVAPPPGWVGKSWALEQACRAARGEWLLIVDADTILEPTLLRDAVTHALEERWDALSLLPRLGTDSFWIRAAMPVYEWIVAFGLPFVHRDGAGGEKASACGAFFLLRRAALDACGGFAAVGGYVAEDIALARRVKRQGFRIAYERADDRFWTPHYRDVGELLRGFAKNLWTPAFGVGRGLLVVLILWCLALGPLIGLGLGRGVAAVCQLLAFAPAYVGPGKGSLPWRVVWAPLVLAMMGLVILANMARVRRGAGLIWKDRRLHAAQRQKG